MDREQMLNAVRSRSDAWDIVVIGGGATGVGCALDAATRGFDVLLVEQHDLGKATSSRSTKLIHGGVRYLEQGNVSLVREALQERGRLLRNAPHVVHRQAFVVPCYSHWQKIYYGIGLKLYDLMAGSLGLGRSRILSASETRARLPTVNAAGLKGGVLYYDGQFDDSRLLIDLAMTAYENGAVLLNYVRAASIDHDAVNGRSALTLEDMLTGEELHVTAKVVINAAGIFSDRVRRMTDAASADVLTFSQGIHLVVPADFLSSDNALLIPRTSDGRVLFCIPWHGKTLIGTTETPVDLPILEPIALESEIDFVLDAAGKVLARPLTRKDVLSVFAGIRPLIRSGADRPTSSLSRGHLVEVRNGVVTITGGKWTTYRKMAEDAVDAAVSYAGLRKKPATTCDLMIKAPSGTPGQNGAPLHPDLPYTEADVIRAVRVELAQTVEDVLARRTRALFLDALAAIQMAPKVAAIMAREKGKDETWIGKQIEEFSKLARSYTAD